MPKVIHYPTADGQSYRRVCTKPGPKPLPDELKRRRIDLMLDPRAIKRGKKAAREMGLSFSRYVEFLTLC